MADKKISGLTALTTPASGDFLAILDISDTTSGADGTTKKVTKANLLGGILNILTNTATLDYASIATLAYEDLTITVTGAKVGDSVALGLPAAPLAGVVFNAWVSATDTVTIRANNYTGTSKDPASASYRVTVFNYS